MQQKSLQDDLERNARRGFIEEEEFSPQLKSTGHYVFNQFELGGKKRKHTTRRRRRRQKKHRHSRKTRRNRK